MASILRSSKFVRYIAGFARNIVVNTPREFDGSFVNTTQCLCGAVPRSLSAQASVQHDQNLERSLRRIDQDVRRSGRISRRDIEDVLEEIRNSRSATSSQSLLVIRCCGNLVPEEQPEVRTKLVQEIWNTLKKLNVPMDISHYNALLRVYLENEHEFSPTEFLAELESRGIDPNRVTYQRLIARYCQQGDIDGATKILEFMREKQLPVNENVFNALITGHSEAGDMDSAQGILKVMTQAGLEPSADTYTTLLCGYAKKGDIEAINSILNECEQKEIFLLDKDYLDIIYALAINGHNEHVQTVLDKTRKAFGYNQDAINLVLRLINKGHEEVGYTILKSIPRGTKPDGSQWPIGAFFIKQMVKANRPVEEIVKYCDKLQEDEFYERGILLATEICLELGKEQLAYDLLDKLKSKGLPIRQHYFWPLIVAKASDPTGNAIIDILLKMAEYDITPSTETIKDYVIPNIKGKSSEIIAKLREANISVGAAACSIVHSLLQKHDIEEAAIIISKIPAFYYPDILKRPLTASLYATNDFESYITIVRYVVENLHRIELLKHEPGEIKPQLDKTEVLGSLIYDLTFSIKKFSEIVEDLLNALVEQGLSLSTITAEKIQEKLNEQMTPSISDLLSKLTSGELTPVPLTKKSPTYTPSSQMNIPQLERLIHNLEAKKQDTKGLKRQLLTLYYREKELDKLEGLLKSMEQDSSFVYTAGIYAQLMDIYAHHNQLEQAEIYFNKLKEMEPELKIDDAKTIRYISALVKHNRFDEAIDLAHTVKKEQKREEKSFAYRMLCWKLLNYLAEEGKAEELNKLFNVLVKEEFIEVNNVILGPLVKVHLVNKDIPKALETFEWCCNQFKATPWKNELACQLIQCEDAEKLQKLTDLSTSVHGEINSLYDLVFAFVECGRIRQARKILETPGLQSRPQRINSACQRYQMEGMVKPLEGLKDATKDLNHIDRTDIYYQLLLSYIKQDDPEKAMNLWTQMQEEDLAPTDNFLIKLGEFLSKHNLHVPFVIPESEEVPRPATFPKRTTVTTPSNNKRDIIVFRQTLKSGNVDAALDIRKHSDNVFTINDDSNLIEKLIQENRIQEATNLTRDLLQKNQTPMTRVFRFLLNKLANNGDVKTIEELGTYLNKDVKKLVSFDNRICHANLVGGNSTEYLQSLENDIDNATPEDLPQLAEKFPRGGVVGILEKHPEYTAKFADIAKKYADRGVISPINVLWAQYFVKGEHEKAEQIWQQYLQGAPRIMFQRVVQVARENKDETLIRKLIEHLKISSVTDGAIGNAYSCLLDVLVAKDNNTELVQVFETAIKEIPIDTINRTAVIRVKEVYNRLGKPFDYKIPPKINKPFAQKSSSSHSSEEETKRKN
ncbi:Pentacotripeptide-repeat region of PRORP [Popillia japonica]|uniref:Pentacotripeptide-repeat region of PRORP n=1 Tax=Popillia japonica TaxID=7064 RepID=A0AAW1JT12_POPJA